MITFGILLIILGFIFSIPPLYSIGIVLLVIGLIFWFIPVGGHTRRWY